MTPDGTRMSAPTRGGPSGSGRLEPNRGGHRSAEPMPLAPMLGLFGALALAGCGRAREPQLFERLPPERSGVTFVNRLPDDTAFSILDYMYYYDGGGVAVGDVN